MVIIRIVVNIRPMMVDNHTSGLYADEGMAADTAMFAAANRNTAARRRCTSAVHSHSMYSSDFIFAVACRAASPPADKRMVGMFSGRSTGSLFYPLVLCWLLSQETATQFSSFYSQ
jgi:hypothetical protein